MKRQIVSCGIFAMLLLASCNGAQQTSEVDLIDIAGGMEKLTELKVSDLGKTIRYIPLETTDSCLIGDFPNIKLLDDKIMVYNGKQCLLFDKETGKFICSVGHRGDDPEAYSSTCGYLNPKNQLLYFNRDPNQLTRVRDNILKSKEQKNIQPTKGGHKMVTCQNYVSLFYRQITSCPSDGGIS